MTKAIRRANPQAMPLTSQLLMAELAKRGRVWGQDNARIRDEVRRFKYNRDYFADYLSTHGLRWCYYGYKVHIPAAA